MTSRYKCRVGRTAATRHATLDAAAARRGAASLPTTIMQPPLAGMTVTSRYKCRVWYIVMKIYYHQTSAGLGCGRFDTLHEFYQRIGSCVVVVVLRAVDTRRRLHPYNDHTLWRLGGAGDAVGIPRNCCSASRPDIRHGCRRKTPSTSNKNCIPLGNKTRTIDFIFKFLNLSGSARPRRQPTPKCRDRQPSAIPRPLQQDPPDDKPLLAAGETENGPPALAPIVSKENSV